MLLSVPFYLSAQPDDIDPGALSAQGIRQLTVNSYICATGSDSLAQTESYLFDRSGALISRTQSDADGTVAAAAMTYDAHGQRIFHEIQHYRHDREASVSWTPTYDARGYLVSETDNRTSLVRSYAYDEAGRRVLTEIRQGRGQVLIFSERVAYNTRGLPTQRHETEGLIERRWLYQYDAAGRLTEVTRRISHCIEGGAVEQERVRYAYDAQGRRIRAQRLDQRGHVLATRSYHYGADGHLARVVNGTTETRYTRDAQGLPLTATGYHQGRRVWHKTYTYGFTLQGDAVLTVR
ncbi:MAG: hypothetical protein OHK0039_08960 [Bacteroidia bacterium]